jgi:hypothetical protein
MQKSKKCKVISRKKQGKSLMGCPPKKVDYALLDKLCSFQCRLVCAGSSFNWQCAATDQGKAYPEGEGYVN